MGSTVSFEPKAAAGAEETAVVVADTAAPAVPAAVAAVDGDPSLVRSRNKGVEPRRVMIILGIGPLSCVATPLTNVPSKVPAEAAAEAAAAEAVADGPAET